MIRNKICAYCRKPMSVKTINEENTQSYEHLIPNVATNRKRKKDEADFYVCRACNTQKSKVDNILGKCAKIQGKNDEIALRTIKKERSKNSPLFKSLKSSASISLNGPIASMPIKGPELIEYISFLGKGQFLRQTGKIYDPQKNVMEILWANKQIMSQLEKDYETQHHSNPFRDLKKNPNTELINDGECVINSDKFKYLFFIHDYFFVSITILPNTRRNREKAKLSERNLLRWFLGKKPKKLPPKKLKSNKKKKR